MMKAKTNGQFSFIHNVDMTIVNIFLFIMSKSKKS